MKNKIDITIVCKLFLSALIFLFFSRCTQNKNEKILTEVDNALTYSIEAQKSALRNADSISEIAKNSGSKNQKFEMEIEASDTWRPLDLKKSLHHLRNAVKIAPETSEAKINIVISRLKLASLYNSQGALKNEAYKIFEDLNIKEMPDSVKSDYYVLGVQLNSALADETFDETLKDKYEKITASYRDSVLLFNNKNSIIAANKLIENKDYRGALKLMMTNRPDGEKFSRQMAPYYNYVAQLYKRLNQPDSQLYYLSLSTVADLKNGIKEYKSLTELAELIASDDIERAYRYINQSFKDANESHSVLRQHELSGPYREIVSIYNSHQRQKTYIVTGALIGILIISLVIIFALLSLKRKNRKLKTYADIISNSRKELETINNKLNKLNAELAQQSRIKEHYIKSFMELSLSYLSQMESFRAEIAKIAAKGDYKNLTDRIQSARYVNREIQLFFDNFDSAFLSINPDFITYLNSFLKEEFHYDINLKKLNTELRIYALIKLGIQESNQISKFLRCSESTVYNYRTKMRNKSTDRDNFELKFTQTL